MGSRSLLGVIGALSIGAALALSSARSEELLPCYQLPADVSPSVALSLFQGPALATKELKSYNPRMQPGDLLYVPRGAPYLELCPEQYRPFVRFWYGVDDNL